MKKNSKDSNNVGLICSIVQITLSLICMIYNIVTGGDYLIWIIFLCSGICILLGNTCEKNKRG